ncbi:MAG TPA: aconitate hydratase, partial [Devosia sp.]|nr:aconitate hydratase [Devosia sp.]
EKDLVACAVLSGNRNFEGRISPDIKANYLASPPLVVAYALLGKMSKNITTDILGHDKQGNPVYLKDLWPSNAEISEVVRASITRDMFRSRYGDVFKGDKNWQGIEVSGGETYAWNPSSTYVQLPPYFEGLKMSPDPVQDVKQARVLGLFADSITTDHISPAGSFKVDSPAGKYLVERQVAPKDFNSYGARRGNHQVMMRGTFANIRIKNQMLKGVEGGYTKGPDGSQMPIYDAAMAYRDQGTDLVVFGGKEYGTGSSRDWAAKGTLLLGVRAVIVESFERIHRSNLIGMGVLPLQFKDNKGWKSLGMSGDEIVSIAGVDEISPRGEVEVNILFADGSQKVVTTLCRIDTENEMEYFRNGGILQYVLRNLVSE